MVGGPNPTELLDTLGVRRVLAVSHGFHLPRIKLACQRQSCEVYTVHARESYVLRALPYSLAREVLAHCVLYSCRWGAEGQSDRGG